jgi:hypothetical protein
LVTDSTGFAIPAKAAIYRRHWHRPSPVWCGGRRPPLLFDVAQDFALGLQSTDFACGFLLFGLLAIVIFRKPDAKQ